MGYPQTVDSKWGALLGAFFGPNVIRADVKQINERRLGAALARMFVLKSICPHFLHAEDSI
jgi:hypothetical protein